MSGWTIASGVGGSIAESSSVFSLTMIDAGGDPVDLGGALVNEDGAPLLNEDGTPFENEGA